MASCDGDNTRPGVVDHWPHPGVLLQLLARASGITKRV